MAAIVFKEFWLQFGLMGGIEDGPSMFIYINGAHYDDAKMIK